MSLLTALLVGLAGTAPAGEPIVAPSPETVDVAPLSEAITFGRVSSAGAIRTIVVSTYADGVVHGVDLGTLLGRPIRDPIDVLAAEGWEGLYDRLVAAPLAARVTVSAKDLALPVDLADHHVAAGTNYAEHAGEADMRDGPFLFAKLVQPTGATSSVAIDDALLDYEVELAFVTLDAVREGATPSRMGLLVCNDYTDRATLLRHVDVWNPASGTGFTTGKSRPGYLPVGDLFVVPRDPRAFVSSLGLRLWVNGELRQRARADEWIWDMDRLLAETWTRRDVTWRHAGRYVSLLSPEKILPARTLLMAGTPAGTVFRGIGLADRVRGLLAWSFGGWTTPLPRHVIEAHIGGARRARTYLQPGDRVHARIDRLGSIVNTIVP